MSAPRRTLNPSVTQYIAVILILVCTFVLLSEQKKVRKEIVPQLVAKHTERSSIILAERIDKAPVLDRKYNLESILVNEAIGPESSLYALATMVQAHDLTIEFSISGSPEQLANAVRVLEKLPLPEGAVRYLLKSGKPSLNARVVGMVHRRLVKAVL